MNTEELRNLLWQKQLELNHVVNYPFQDRVDENITRVIDNVPVWFNNAFVYGGLINAYDEKLSDFIDTIKDYQAKIKRLIGQREQFEAKIKSLKKEIADARQYQEKFIDKPTTQDGEIEDAIESLKESIDQHKIIYERLVEDVDNHDRALEEVNNFHEDIMNEIHMYEAHLANSAQTTKQFRKNNQELEGFLRNIKIHRTNLYKRRKELTQLADSLKQAIADNERTYKILEDKYIKHQKLVTDYEEIEDKIRQIEQNQEMTLTKTIETTKVAEHAMAEVTKQRAINEKMSNEITRLNNLTREKAKELNAALEDHISTISHGLENISNDLKERAAEIASQNQDIVQDRAVVSRRLEISQHENAALLGAHRGNGFEAFMQKMADLKNEIDTTAVKIDNEKTATLRLNESLNELKTKTIEEGKDLRVKISELQEKSDILEERIEFTRKAVSETIHQNERLNGANQILRKRIIDIKRRELSDSEKAVSNKQAEIDEARRQLSMELAGNARAKDALQAASLGYKRHADKWKARMQEITMETSDTNMQITQKQEAHREEARALKQMLKDRVDEVNVTAAEVNELTRQEELLKAQLKRRKDILNRQSSMINDVEKIRRTNNSVIGELKRKARILDSKISEMQSAMSEGSGFIAPKSEEPRKGK